jgi:hypothetical protein
VTWDERIFTPPSEGSIGSRLKEHLLAHPIGKLMFEDAVAAENDARIYKHLPYYSTEVCADGWILAGDAAGFMDPLYSQGLDYCAHATYTAHKILLKALDGGCVKEDLAFHDETYTLSYQRWFHGLYKNKYQYLGDADLMHAAFLLDIAAYFIGPVRLVYQWTDAEFSKMPYNGSAGAAFATFMAFYNARLEKIARKLLANGTYGENNLHHRYFIRIPFETNNKAVGHLFRGIRTWLKLELKTAFTSPVAALVEPAGEKTGPPMSGVPLAPGP